MHPWSDIRRGIPFRLLQGDSLLGTLAVHEVRESWLICAFEPAAAFAPLRSLFDTTSGTFAEPQQSPVAAAAWAEVCAQLAARGVCVGTSRGTTDCFLLHIDGHKAWLRFGTPDDPAECAAANGRRQHVPSV